MWFVDNHKDASIHRVLPWYHQPSESLSSPKAAPRHKIKGTTDFVIKTGEEWAQFQRDVESGKKVERVIVQPSEPNLVRNPSFAEQLGELAASKGFVVQLAGGILSHAYYILRRKGAEVECVDLFGTSEDIVEYNKLVRDRVPEVITNRGERAETSQLVGDALILALRRKLVEEAYEALDAKSGDDLVGELADVQEVIRGMIAALQIPASQLLTQRREKRKRRGGFDRGLMLLKTASPQSLSPKSSDATLFDREAHSENTRAKTIRDVANLPVDPFYRRPDLRHVEEHIEKQITFEVTANQAEQIAETFNFAMPVNRELEIPFSLDIELKRTGSVFRGTVRLRPNPVESEAAMLNPQLRFKFA
jgi:predicted house-cleaning noncanonical NTP pyrophosphatase (MazG superfamily)